MRMDKHSFMAVCNEIRSYEGFNKNGRRKQMPVEIQLMATLRRLGSFGTGASVGKIARECGISEGSVHEFTRRIFKAILSIEKRFVYWPTAAEREEISEEIEKKSGFPDCIGCMEGSLIPVMYKPSYNGDDFYNRKNCYGLNILAVCDYLHRFRYAHLGFSGCAHDSRVYKESPLALNPGKYFDAHEYVLADSGYVLHTTVILPHKKPSGQDLDRKQLDYSYMHAKGRVPIENTFVKRQVPVNLDSSVYGSAQHND
ncbi:hypothetical protein G6F56_004410 [Rhizopus delemar]|nr:hypothetical protein G6F56_004410 [Rhizopus delemar]